MGHTWFISNPTWVYTDMFFSLSHLEPLDGLFTPRAEHDAVMQAADGSSTTGQGGERGGGTHPCHSIGHCGEITPFIDSLASIVIVLVIRKVCRGVARWGGVGWGKGKQGMGGREIWREKQAEKGKSTEGKVEKRGQREIDI